MHTCIIFYLYIILIHAFKIYFSSTWIMIFFFLNKQLSFTYNWKQKVEKPGRFTA